jgi:hypothetical protein
LLHRGRILSPYLSFEYQNVRSGDKIVIHSLPPKDRDPGRRRQSSDGVLRPIPRCLEIVQPQAELPKPSDRPPTQDGTAGGMARGLGH